jgi:hypothetical protein
MDLVEDTDSSKADTKDSGTGSASDDDTFDPGEHTVTDVLTYLDTADRDEAVRVLDAEAAGQARKGISSERETILASKEGQRMTVLGAYRGPPRRPRLPQLGRPPGPDADVPPGEPAPGGTRRRAGGTAGVMTTVDAAVPRRRATPSPTLTFISAGTAASGPTNYWFALYSPAGALLGAVRRPDQHGVGRGHREDSFALTTAQKLTKSGIYYAGISFAGTTPPSLIGTRGQKPVLSGEVNLAQSSGSGLTATAPGTIATPAFKAATPLVIAS